MSRAPRIDADTRLTRLTGTCADDVLAYLIRRVDSPEDAADLLGEALLALAAAPHRIPSSAEGGRMWFFGIARNQLKRYYRGARSADDRTARLRDALATTAGEHPGPDSDEAATGAHVRDAVRSLPERQRELVALVHWDGFSLAEAAQLLGIRSSTARTHYQKARLRLRDALGAEYAGGAEPDYSRGAAGGKLHEPLTISGRGR